MSPEGVAGAPFSLQVRSEDAVSHQAWSRACTDALAALRRGESVAVFGQPGTGKTFLLQRLSQMLRSDGLRVGSFAVPEAQAPASQHDVLLVDEADRLPGATLHALCSQDQPFILAGLPGIAKCLVGHARPVVTVMLEPLSPEDVARFVAARLSATGHRRDLLEADAVLALARHSAGLLRLVVVLAGSAMFLAEHEGAERVSKRHVDEAAAMREVSSDDQVSQSELAGRPWQISAPAETVVVAHREPELHSLPFVRANRVALGLSGLLLLAVLGWMLLPGRAFLPMSIPPQREASLTPPSAPVPTPSPPSAAQPSAPSPVPAPVVLTAPVTLPGTGPEFRTPSSANVDPPVLPPQVQPILAFQGPILNETMNQKGRLSLGLRRSGRNTVIATFHAFAGLIGSGDLTGTITPDGHITASGRLMMGRNPFDTTLTATITGDRLEGTAVFARPDASSPTRSRFSLTRS